MNALAGQNAIITGASRGIGRAIAVELGAMGARVFVNYRTDRSAAEATVRAIAEAGGPPADLIQADVGRPEDAARLVEHALSRAGSVQVLVNNAAVQRGRMLHKMSDEDWRVVMATNLDAVFYLCRAVLPSMRAAGAGHIVNIASASSYVAQPGASSYIASKHGLIGLTKALALENARRGIYVNAVAPGLTDTDLVADLNDAQREALLSLVPLGRMAESAEVASMVGWVITRARYSTGNVFHASGGVVMG